MPTRTGSDGSTSKSGGAAIVPVKETIEGHLVEIRELSGREALWIDGKRHAYFLTADGYTLHADAYARPRRTLLDVVRAYLRKHSTSTGHNH